MAQLTNDQIDGLIRLIDDEVALNIRNGDDAYNPWWIRIKTKLAKAKTS